ncbi:MAG: hypothetical protein JXB35_11350 [Anaerolineae bacterium]|nr:hypothetical protein [Anaerolineae bacterium]
MDGYTGGRSPRPAAGRGLTHHNAQDWRVLALSGAGIFFIVLGLIALALPSTQEGELVWLMGPQHALRLMDLAGALAAGFGVVLTWLSGQLWRRQVRS